jgi:hypothetical protein
MASWRWAAAWKRAANACLWQEPVEYEVGDGEAD